MLLTKSFLNEQVQKRVIKDNFILEKRQVKDEYDVFISYSWNDRFFADKIVQLLEKCGYSVYIDYKDTRLDRNNVSEATAQKLIQVMRKCKGLLHLYSPSASVSKWCPWEVGVFSGIKNFRCANLPLLDREGESFKNQEYLEIYPYADYEKTEGTQKYDFWICEDDNTYASLRAWLNGIKPTKH